MTAEAPKVFTRVELRRLPAEQADGKACLICGEKFTGRRVAVARMGFPRYDLYTHPKCKPLFRLVSYSQYGSC